MEFKIKIDENWVNFENINMIEFDDLESEFLFLVDNEVKANGYLRIDYTDIYIEEVEATEKRKGYGKMFVDYIKSQSQVKRIAGQSTQDAYNFWESMKANLNHNTFKDEGVYSFYIDCN